MNTIKESINSEAAFETNLSMHPWIEPFVIRVSVGLALIINDFLNNIEDIFRTDKPELAYLRITEEVNGKGDEDDISALYQRRLRIFIQADQQIKARDEALHYMVLHAINLSLETCFRCGRELETKDIKDEDERRLAPFLPTVPDNVFRCISSICMSCAFEHWEKEQKSVTDSISEISAVEGTQSWSNTNAQQSLTGSLKEVTEEEAKALSNADKGELEGIHRNAKDELRAKENKRDKQTESVPEPTGKSIAIYSTDEVDKLLSDNTDATRDQAARIKGLVKKIRKVSASKKLVTIPEQWCEYCDQLALKFPNFKDVVLFIRYQLALSSIGDNVLRLPPILLVGGPGIGKSEFCLTVANDFNTTLKIIDISSAQTGSALTGSEAYWGNTQPGMLFTELVLGSVANPIIMLDELDKSKARVEYDPLAALHTLLEPRQAKRFQDLSVPDIIVDASHIIWIATANSVESLDAPILDRFTVFNVADPETAQMIAIVNSQYQRFIDKHPSGSIFEKEIRDDVREELCNHHPRKVRKLLEQAFGLAAFDKRNYLIVQDIKDSDVSKTRKKTGIGFVISV